MTRKFHPEFNKVYFTKKYTMLHILKGSGSIEVDFKRYHNWRNKLIFLEKGQNIKFLSENFKARKFEFDDDEVIQNQDVRVLFKHLVSMGYINFGESKSCQGYLNNTLFSQSASDIIDSCTKQWFLQNPFHANKEEYDVIFDFKDIIDKQYKNHLPINKIFNLVDTRRYEVQTLFKRKLGLTVKSMLSQKRFLEIKKEIAFTDKSIKEIAFNNGYKDPAYFTRIFSKIAGYRPSEFRTFVSYENRDSFLPELYQLIEAHHKQHHSLDFYANKMNLSIKTLSKKVKNKLHITLGQLIRQELINTAKILLRKDINIKEIASQLGFEEANHFSAFFKHYSSLSPIEYRQMLISDKTLRHSSSSI